MKRFASILTGLLFLVAPLSFAQLWSGVLDPARAIDWTNVGANIQNYTVPCATQPTLIAGSGNHAANTTAINAAIASCDATHNVVNLASGTYYFDGYDATGQSNYTVRGAGGNQTLLIDVGVQGCGGLGTVICYRSSDGTYTGQPPTLFHNITGGLGQGSKVITLDSASGLSNGQLLAVDQCDDGYTGGSGTGVCTGAAADTGNIFQSDTQLVTNTEIGSNNYRAHRTQAQIAVITNISGTTITLDTPLVWPQYRTGQQPQAWPVTPVKNVGVENLSVDCTASTDSNCILFQSVTNFWVKGVRSINPLHYHVTVFQGQHGTIRDSYYFATQNAAQESYGIQLQYASWVLVENNIFQQIAAPIVWGGSTVGDVIGYNYNVNDLYGTQSWLSPGQTLHSAGVGYELIEGNQSSGLQGDAVHGDQHMVTAFRNYFAGWDALCDGVACTSQTNAVYLYAFKRYFNIAFNVLGEPSHQNNYECANATTTDSCAAHGDTSIYSLGFSGPDSQYSGCCTGTPSPNDTLVKASLMRWGNYDTVNAATRFVAGENGSGASTYPALSSPSTTAPPSFYYSAKPTWWPSGKPWPPIGPDVTGGNITGLAGHAYTVPAADCYSNVMGGPSNGSGAVLSFNAASCYAAVTPTVPSGPVKLYYFSGPASPTTDAGFNSVVNANVLTGVVLEIPWSSIDVDGNPAHYTWSALDTTLLGPYLTNYPQLAIDLIVAPALDISLSGHANTYTPNYVFTGATNVCFCPTYTGDGRAAGCYTDKADLTGIVPSFDSFFLSNYSTFIGNLIAHLNLAAYKSSIALHVVGYSHGGESNPVCSTQIQTLVTPSTSAQLITTWENMTQTLDGVVQAAAPTFPVTVTIACLGNAKPPTGFSTGNNCNLADAEAASHIAHGIGLRGTGLQSADILSTAGNAPASSDWVVNWRNYPNAPGLDLQQSAESAPTGACSSTAGSFTALGPFALQHWPSQSLDVWEVYSQDLKGTYAPSFTDSCWPTACITGSCPYVPYANVFQNAIAGNPVGTAVQNGLAITTRTNTSPSLVLGPPLYLGTSTSTAALGTLSPPWSTTTLYNSTYYSPLNPGTDCQTRLTDQNVTGPGGMTATNLGQAAFTASGGANDVMVSKNTTYLAATHNSGSASVFHLNASGPCIQNVSQGTGENPGIDVAGFGGFSYVSDPVFYYVTSEHILNQGTITSDTTYTTTSNANFPFDYDNCPGPVGSGAGMSHGILGFPLDDSSFTTMISWTGGQGTAHLILSYKPGVGCSTLDVATGNWYGYCASSCSTVAPSGTETACLSPNWSTGSGIHDVQTTKDGLVTAASGGCFNLGVNNINFWTINSGNVLGIQDTTSTWDGNVASGGHDTEGVTHHWATHAPTPNIRVSSPLTTTNLGAYTTLQTFNATALGDAFHGGEPHPTGNDSYPWILETGSTAGNYLTPLAYQNEVFAISPTAGASVPRFGSTFNSGTANQATHFGCGAAIPTISQDGKWAFFLSDGDLLLGNGTDSQPLCSIIGVALQ